jgi:hypothetical protein
MATKRNQKLSRPQLKQQDTTAIDNVRNPNFDAALAQQNYFNTIAQSLANYMANNYPSQGSAQISTNQNNVQNPVAIDGQQNANNIYNALRDYQATTYPVPQSKNSPTFGKQFGQMPPQAMQNYQNFLNQGMNSIASMNQDSMTNFANMQPGMPTTEPAQTSIAKPTMPVAGFGMQKSKVQPAKPSTFSNTPARFG